MIFYGWGPKTKELQLDQYRIVTLRYNHFHIMWLFQIAWGLTYILQTYTEHGWLPRQLSPEEAAYMGAPQQLNLSLWWRWGLLSVPVILIIIAMVANMQLSPPRLATMRPDSATTYGWADGEAPRGVL